MWKREFLGWHWRAVITLIFAANFGPALPKAAQKSYHALVQLPVAWQECSCCWEVQHRVIWLYFRNILGLWQSLGRIFLCVWVALVRGGKRAESCYEL